MQNYEQLLKNNKKWAEGRIKEDPDFFKRLANVQRPNFLWIGCSDSRVPANEVTGTTSGEVFVHRNVANLVIHLDFNLLSVVQYAVQVLKVEHIIVCGHYNCGGINAAMDRKSYGFIDKWLSNVKELYKQHQDELEAIENMEARQDRMVELNVIKQVQNLAHMPLIQSEWRKRNYPILHGWAYGLKDGKVNELCNIMPNEVSDDIFWYEE